MKSKQESRNPQREGACTLAGSLRSQSKQGPGPKCQVTVRRKQVYTATVFHFCGGKEIYCLRDVGDVSKGKELA